MPFIGSNYSRRPASRWDPNMRMPYVVNLAGGVQWEFRQNWLLETNYQGQSGVGLLNSWDMNAIPLNDISRDTATLTTNFSGVAELQTLPAVRLNQLYSNFGRNTHHSGTLRVEKRMPLSQGLTLNAFYTWSKTLTETDAEGGADRHYLLQPQPGEGAGQLRRGAPFRRDRDLGPRAVRVRNRHWMNRGGVLNAQ